MRTLRGFDCVVCFAFIGMFCQQVSAQCYLEVLTWCEDEQFDNPCSEPCYAAGDSCGLKVDPAGLTHFSQIEASIDGSEEFEDAGTTVDCGTTVICRCVGSPNMFICEPTSTVHSGYTVHDYEEAGDECSLTPVTAENQSVPSVP